ncbi:DUF3492 domain-containing protein [Streptomyces sp. NPDC016845]|uniref:DUF3492 domain-containing protein n=1 Tax=Streptomyces sp. NPDC016845 TaxID=3364972 RepID=UPI0037A8FBFC
MRIGLLTEGGYPYVGGETGLWCDRLVRGLAQHEFDLYALSRCQEQEEAGLLELPPQVSQVRTARLWTNGTGSAAGGGGVRGGPLGRRARRRFAALYEELAAAVVRGTGPESGGAGGTGGVGGPGGVGGVGGGDGTGVSGGSPQEADRFATALYGLAELARDEGSLHVALRSEAAVRILERACRAPGALRATRTARVPDLLACAGHIERALRPLSLDWYVDRPFDRHEDDATGARGDRLGSVDLCHATSGGAAALPGLIAKQFFGVPLLVTEYGVRLRAQYIAAGDAELSAPVRALLASFHGLLAAEVYRQATVITPGNAHARRWQERCGADRAKMRTVHPGMDASRFAEVGEREEPGEPDTLVWVGRVEPAKDLISLLHAFAEIRKEEPKARLRIVGAMPVAGPASSPASGPTDSEAGREAELYLGHCKALAAQLFPDEATGIHAVGENPVSFEEFGEPETSDLAEVYGAGSVVVLSSVVEGFPVSLVEAMLCGRATVSTDVGAVVEVIGGTGLVVPPRNPRALAEACVALLRDSGRRERLGAAARARALELFTVEQNITAFHSIYLDIVSHCPVRRDAMDDAGAPLPFSHPAEAHVPGHWTARTSGTARVPSWAPGGAGGGEREHLAGVGRSGGEGKA